MFTKHQGQAHPPTASVNVAKIFAAHEAARLRRTHSPYIPFYLATLMVALTTVMISYSNAVPVFLILAFFAMWLPLLIIKYRAVLRPSIDMAAMFLIPLLCLASTLWSDYPRTTLYLGTAFVALAVCILIIARTVRFESLAAGIVIGTCAVLALTLLNGTYSFDPTTGRHALVGVLGSKNMTGFYAELGIIATLLYGLSRPGLWRKLLYTTPPLIFCLYCLYLSRSGTSFASLLAAIMVILAGLAIGRSARQIRALMLAFCIIVVGTIFAAASLLNASDYVLTRLGKDSTLTGRTYLWSEGINTGMQHPILGHGYSAFWVHGQPQAERLWHEFFISTRMGFHFHNTWVQTFVDLGLLGAALITLLILASCILSLRAIVRLGSSPEALFLLGISFMFALRAVAEIDFFVGPFGMGTILFYAILPRLAQLKAKTIT